MSIPEPVVIVGAGNLGKLLWDCLDGDDRWEVIGFIDDGLAGTMCFGLPVYGAETYDDRLTRNAFLAIGYPDMRRSMLDRTAPLGLSWRTFIDRRAIVGRYATVGRGVLVLSFAMVASGVTIGDFAYLSSYAQIGTGAELGAFSSMLGGAAVGKSKVGKDCILGLKSACLDGAVIGDGATVAPLTLVRKDVPPGSVVAGSPARITSKQRTGLD